MQLLEFDAHRQLRSLERRGDESAYVLLQSLEIHCAFRESSVDERTRAAQQLGRSVCRRAVGGTAWRDICGGMDSLNLRTLFVKLPHG